MSSSVLFGDIPFRRLCIRDTLFDLHCVFGYVQNLSPRLNKLSSRLVKYVFVGYSKTQKEYCCYNPAIRQYLVSANVTFSESTPFFPNSPPTNSSIMLPLPSLVDTILTECCQCVSTITVDRPLQVYTHRLKEARSTVMPILFA